MGNVENLTSNAAVSKIRELATDAGTCHFVTNLSQLPLTTRPMAVLDVDDEGNCWFFSKAGSEKIADIRTSPYVQLFFANNGSAEYLTVYGDAVLLNDAARAKALWTPIAKAWFPDGADDPELTIIKVTPLDAYYWDTKNNKLVTLIKILAGAVTGHPMDDGVQGAAKV